MVRTLAKPFSSATPCPHVTGTPLDQDEPIVTEQIDFSSLLFGNPVTFLAFLAEVIKQTILARDKNENINVQYVRLSLRLVVAAWAYL